VPPLNLEFFTSLSKYVAMETNQPSRRDFLGALAASAATIGMTTLTAPVAAHAKTLSDHLTDPNDPEELFKQLNGKHKVVFDVTEPNDILPFAWPRVFLITNEKTGTPAKDNSVVVVLRHSAIGYAMEDALWTKYNFGEVFKAEDPATKAPSRRNPFWKPKPGDFKVPGVGNVAIGINELQDSGVKFCVCDVALTVYSAVVAEGMKKDAAEVKKDWVAGLLPGIHIVPSGVWAVGRAQERGCAYIFAG
jgi:intracellular sulfur oxidation DsrE/DsrF family protein